MPATLSAPARLGWRLALGALGLIGAAWIFSALAESALASARVTAFDADVAAWLHRHATPALTAWMLAVTQLHSTFAIACYAVVAACAFAVRRQWRRVTTLVVCIGGVLALNGLTKLAFHRARPVFDDPLLTLATYSFPSGHVAASTVFYGLLVAWVFRRTRRRMRRIAVLLGAAVAIALVAFTRMYLGVHYLSDVVAAFVEGSAWLALCLGALAGFRREDSSADGDAR
jgi:undecaprenyl-diphosphatase